MYCYKLTHAMLAMAKLCQNQNKTPFLSVTKNNFTRKY
jgi:hypothetical protein